MVLDPFTCDSDHLLVVGRGIQLHRVVVIAPHPAATAALGVLGRRERVDQDGHRCAYVKGARGAEPSKEGVVV